MNILGFDKPIKNTKIVVAMSGGVDSSVAAAMLKKQGYDVVGVTMRLYNQTDKINNNKSCCAGRDINDASIVANQFNFPHHALNYQEKFFNEVIDDFVESYINGKTPIPCIRCNQTVKFTDMLKVAKDMEADAMVTGHYVRRVGGLKDAKLYRALDNSKDQSYFLFATTSSQLEYLRFPLGEYKKEEVRGIAKKLKLKVTDKPDSQDICFVTDGSYSNLISKLKPDSFIEGNIVDISGKVIGKHNGTVNYTIGQRKKIGIGGFKKPLYVINILKDKNIIVVGEKENLKVQVFKINNLNWISKSVHDNMFCDAKIRSTQVPSSGKIKILDDNKVQFHFDEPQFSTSPGQACVFYKNNEVLGGGWIEKN